MCIKAAQWAGIVALGVFGTGARAQSNVDATHALAESEQIGRVSFAPSELWGARINQFYCAGFLYAENAGWIQLGSGEPANGLSYQNDSAADYGVNVLPSGALRGYAYGANIGWINFSEEGNARVDWTTGRITGRMYAANTGWIEIGSGGDSYIQLDSLASAADDDADGLPDAWEIGYTGGLAMLGTGDADGDGSSDAEEYHAGTDPLEAEDYLALELGLTENQEPVLAWNSKHGIIYRVEERFALDLEEEWVTASADATGDGQGMVMQLPGGTEPMRFFRLTAFPPLSAPQ